METTAVEPLIKEGVSVGWILKLAVRPVVLPYSDDTGWQDPYPAGGKNASDLCPLGAIEHCPVTRDLDRLGVDAQEQTIRAEQAENSLHIATLQTAPLEDAYQAEHAEVMRLRAAFELERTANGAATSAYRGDLKRAKTAEAEAERLRAEVTRLEERTLAQVKAP